MNPVAMGTTASAAVDSLDGVVEGVSLMRMGSGPRCDSGLLAGVGLRGAGSCLALYSSMVSRSEEGGLELVAWLRGTGGDGEKSEPPPTLESELLILPWTFWPVTAYAGTCSRNVPKMTSASAVGWSTAPSPPLLLGPKFW